jgi:uncharacterized protein DUF1839
MTAQQLLPLSVASYQPHELHATERIWTETNCYVDVWIEVLHSLGLEPLAAAAFALSADFEGDQWAFFKYPPEDLRAVYGIEVSEMNVWRPVLDHVLEHLSLGRLLTVEADSWFLPDTHGVSYQIAHTKSTIVPNAVDVERRHLGYLHNASYFELEGEDFDGVFRRGAFTTHAGFAPYVETVKVDDLITPDDDGLTELALHGLRDHVARLPDSNPIARMSERIAHDLEWLRGEDIEMFHLYAFGTCRQCGASAELASDFLNWMAPRLPTASDALHDAATKWREISETAKALQFTLARAARGRNADIAPQLATMAECWTEAAKTLTTAIG